MIVEMRKVHLVTRHADREALLAALRGLGVLHVVPTDPAQAAPDEKTAAAVERIDRAIQALSSVEPRGQAPALSPRDAADEVLAIHRRSVQQQARLAALHRQIEQSAVWGDVTVGQFEHLRRGGVELRFCILDDDRLGDVQAELVHVIETLPGGRSLLAVADRTGRVELPEAAHELPLPRTDRPTLRAEAAQIDDDLRRCARRVGQIANLLPAMQAERREMLRGSEFLVALRSGLADADLYGLQGWAAAPEAEHLPAALAAAGIDAAAETFPPAADEQPPTLICYPRWARPIQGLFDMLGTDPGYREYDLAPFFMVALPIFAAMLIGDAGYGLLLLLVPLLWRRKMAAAVGSPSVHLLMVMGAATVIWGLLTGNVFGVSPAVLTAAGGAWAALGAVLGACQWIGGDIDQQTTTIMKVSFILGAVHLSLAQLRQALGLYPDRRFLGKIGWAVFLWGIFGVVWYLFFGSRATPPRPLHPAVPYLLAVGAALAIGWAHPGGNPAKRIGLGLASFPLAALSTFSDSISYIRLMGVGLASTIIGQTFNGLGAQVAGAATWVLATPVVLAGHALNVALCMIAILAHGVRLNMREFSSNAGVQWSGYPFRPFADAKRRSVEP